MSTTNEVDAPEAPAQSAGRPLVLIVAMSNSVHTARWLGGLRKEGFRLVLVPVSMDPPIAEMTPTMEVGDAAGAASLSPGVIGLWAGHPSDTTKGPPDALPPPIDLPDRGHLLRAASLVTAVEALRPDLVHSMEVQRAGYTCLEAARIMGSSFPTWLVSNWGSDLQLYRKLAAHRPVLERLARRMDAYLGECSRDLRIARELGYTGPVARPLPASGGVDFATIAPLSQLPLPSTRREILIKGYQGWSGRALHALSAIHLAAPHLRRLRIRIALANPPVAEMAAMLRVRDGLDVVADPYLPSHAEALSRLGAARVTVGIGISDGIGTTTLEAMALGSFPIASRCSCVDEWLRPGRDGLLVDPHDVAALAEAIVVAANDDALVDTAAPRNRAEVERRWAARTNAEAAGRLYQGLTRSKSRGAARHVERR